jgi:hypothetical protein
VVVLVVVEMAGPDKDEVVTDGLKTLKLFLRSFFPRLSAMTDGRKKRRC